MPDPDPKHYPHTYTSNYPNPNPNTDTDTHTDPNGYSDGYTDCYGYRNTNGYGSCLSNANPGTAANHQSSGRSNHPVSAIHISI